MKIPARLSSAAYHVRHFPWLVAAPIIGIAAIGLALVGWQFYHNYTLSQQVNELTDQNQKQLYEAHLQTLAQQKLVSEKSAVEASLAELKSDAGKDRLIKIDAIYTQFKAVQVKVDRNNGVKLDTAAVTNLYADWGTKLLQEKLDDVTTGLTTADATLDKQYQDYRAALPTPTPKPAAVAKSSGSTSSGSVAGYSRTNVSTSRGTFGVYLIKLPLAQYQVKTVTANTTNCTNNCPTKSLAQYMSDNGAYAGINGTYFCPPDYASCAGKTNSYDFAVYNSNTGTWLNEPARFWDSTGMATFSGSMANFYRRSNQFGGGGVTAGISNFPPLLVQNGAVVTSEAEQTAYQQLKSTKGALGVDGSNVYLALISSASMTDAAYVMQALGAKDVLNLDGGGSSAMYIGGGYKVGPGRSLPNAVVLVAR